MVQDLVTYMPYGYKQAKKLETKPQQKSYAL